MKRKDLVGPTRDNPVLDPPKWTTPWYLLYYISRNDATSFSKKCKQSNVNKSIANFDWLEKKSSSSENEDLYKSCEKIMPTHAMSV